MKLLKAWETAVATFIATNFASKIYSYLLLLALKKPGAGGVFQEPIDVFPSGILVEFASFRMYLIPKGAPNVNVNGISEDTWRQLLQCIRAHKKERRCRYRYINIYIYIWAICIYVILYCILNMYCSKK